MLYEQNMVLASLKTFTSLVNPTEKNLQTKALSGVARISYRRGYHKNLKCKINNK